MRCEISKTKDGENAFHVAIIPAIDFPTNDKVAPIVRKPLLAVIGAVLGGDGWSFCELSGDDKHCIGDELLKLQTPVNEWRWCLLYSDPEESSGDLHKIMKDKNYTYENMIDAFAAGRRNQTECGDTNNDCWDFATWCYENYGT